MSCPLVPSLSGKTPPTVMVWAPTSIVCVTSLVQVAVTFPELPARTNEPPVSRVRLTA